MIEMGVISPQSGRGFKNFAQEPPSTNPINPGSTTDYIHVCTLDLVHHNIIKLLLNFVLFHKHIHIIFVLAILLCAVGKSITSLYHRLVMICQRRLLKVYLARVV